MQTEPSAAEQDEGTDCGFCRTKAPLTPLSIQGTDIEVAADEMLQMDSLMSMLLSTLEDSVSTTCRWRRRREASLANQTVQLVPLCLSVDVSGLGGLTGLTNWTELDTFYISLTSSFRA